MDLSSTIPFYGSLNRYWRRRNYILLDITPKDTRAIRLGGKKKRSWKIKATPKLKLGWKILSPIKLLSKLRDAYIKMTLRLASNVGSLKGDNSFGNRRISLLKKKNNKVSKTEEFESKLVYEIYKALKASHQFPLRELSAM